MKKNKFIIFLFQILILITIIVLWEVLSSKEIINSFIFSSPSKICECIKDLFSKSKLISHILITLKETVIAFVLSITISFVIALILYELPILYKILEPYLTVINSMPKVAIGPIIIILFGAGESSIIIMALSITLILNILNIYNGFINVDKYKLKMFKSFNASKYKTIRYLVIPSALSVIVNNLKINISMTLIGVIMGEFLVSKAGIGYLIIYGTQVFNLTLVMSGIIILMIISYVLFSLISYIEKKLINHFFK